MEATPKAIAEQNGEITFTNGNGITIGSAYIQNYHEEQAAIVRAVNEYDRLIADNAALVEALETVHAYITDKAVGEIDTDNDDERFGALLMCGHLFKKCGKVIDAALEAARGE